MALRVAEVKIETDDRNREEPSEGKADITPSDELKEDTPRAAQQRPSVVVDSQTVLV